MEARISVWRASEFEVTIWLGPDSARRFLARDPAEVQAAFVPGPCLLQVDSILRQAGQHADVSLGYLWVWLNSDGMAVVRLDEHCEHFARDPARAGMAGEVGGFPRWDGVPFAGLKGEPFAVPAADAVTAEQATNVLSYWLANGEWWPGLAWD